MTTFSKYGYTKSLWREWFPSDTYYRVVVTLLDHARGDGTNAHPGNELLADECCCSVDTVKRALNYAKKRGLIKLTRRGRNNAGASVWEFPQQGSGAPLYRFDNRAHDTVSPAAQQCTGAPPSKEYQIHPA